MDVTAANASIDNDYGVTRGPNAADVHVVALVDEDGAELDAVTSPGYERAFVFPEDWPPAAGGQKSVLVTFPSPTGEWIPVAGWRLLDADTGAEWDAGDLFDLLEVTTESTDGAQLSVTVFYETT